MSKALRGRAAKKAKIKRWFAKSNDCPLCGYGGCWYVKTVNEPHVSKFIDRVVRVVGPKKKPRRA